MEIKAFPEVVWSLGKSVFVKMGVKRVSNSQDTSSLRRTDK